MISISVMFSKKQPGVATIVIEKLEPSATQAYERRIFITFQKILID